MQLVFQTFLQPLLFVFIFGRVMVGSGYLPPQYKSLLLPGIIAISMVFTGIWAVAMPLIAEFQWTREIEDRLLAPINIYWIAIEKVIAGMIQAAVAGIVVIPLAWLVLGRGLDISVHSPLQFIVMIVLISAFSACGGLALGCSINQQHIGLMFGMVITPMIFFGCTYYPWSALKTFPILQKLVLINPLVYASEGMRATLVPQFSHLSTTAVLLALLFFDIGLLLVGLRQFDNKAIS
jgi:ABC-2 type transport system permease protein